MKKRYLAIILTLAIGLAAVGCNKKGSDDIRMQITLARVQLAKGDEGRARGTLRALRAKQDKLTSYDRRVLEKLLKFAKMQ